MAHVLFFAAAADATGERSTDCDGTTVAEVITQVSDRYGRAISDLLPYCQVMVRQEKADAHTPVDPQDEVAILPPVSGG